MDNPLSQREARPRKHRPVTSAKRLNKFWGEERAAYFAASLALPGAGLGLRRSDVSLGRVVAQAGLAQRRRLELRVPER